MIVPNDSPPPYPTFVVKTPCKKTCEEIEVEQSLLSTIQGPNFEIVLEIFPN